MKTLLLTNEFPPHVYGGAGVHVDYLSRELARLIDVQVRCFGAQELDQHQLSVRGFPDSFLPPAGIDPRFKSLFSTLARCQAFAATPVDAQIVHCHTWYAQFAGILAKMLYGSKLVITVHSLEPLRPWKKEQLGNGYEVSSWIERTALEMADLVIAVSEDTRHDILRHFKVDPAKIDIIHNGIDLDEYQPTRDDAFISSLGIDPARPIVLFVGRITRQKGIVHLVNALKNVDRNAQIVLCAGAPDTPEIAAEMKAAVSAVQALRPDVFWIQDMLGKDKIIRLYSHADVFVCPSIYEPFGIINLEAMACSTAVVATSVGGIKEVVQHGVTGLLVDVEQYNHAPFEPIEPELFSSNLAAAINKLLADDQLRLAMAAAGRKRAVDHFSWHSIAKKTVNSYRSLLR